MPRLNAANRGKSSLASGVSPGDGTLEVEDAESFPDAPFRVVVGPEIMEVTEVNGTTFTVLRGREETPDTSHDPGVPVENRWTAGTYEELAASAEFEAHLADYVKHGELIAFEGHYTVTEFDTPTEGDIQQKMYKSADDTLVVTYTTEFDKPTEGDITETVETADGEVYNEKITEFDEPTEGDIKETVSEVSE